MAGEIPNALSRERADARNAVFVNRRGGSETGTQALRNDERERFRECLGYGRIMLR